MSEYIYDNDYPDEQSQKEEIALNLTGESDKAVVRSVSIYESSGSYEAQKAAPLKTVHQQTGRTPVLCLVLLCVLLLAALIGTGLHGRISLQTHSESWAQEHRKTLVELSAFCANGCRSLNNSFYYISSTKKSWNDSRQDCIDRGGHLVIVNSREEQVLINSFNHVLWIGLSARGQDGAWRWVDDSFLNSTGFWKSGKPPGKSRRQMENCVYTYYYSNENSWDVTKCTEQHHWICEKATDI